MLNRGILNLLQIEVHVLITLQNIWCLIENVVEEFGHKQGSSLVFLARNIDFILELHIVTLQKFILILGSYEFFLDFI